MGRKVDSVVSNTDELVWMVERVIMCNRSNDNKIMNGLEKLAWHSPPSKKPATMIPSMAGSTVGQSISLIALLSCTSIVVLFTQPSAHHDTLHRPSISTTALASSPPHTIGGPSPELLNQYSNQVSHELAALKAAIGKVYQSL